MSAVVSYTNESFGLPVRSPSDVPSDSETGDYSAPNNYDYIEQINRQHEKEKGLLLSRLLEIEEKLQQVEERNNKLESQNEDLVNQVTLAFFLIQSPRSMIFVVFLDGSPLKKKSRFSVWRTETYALFLP